MRSGISLDELTLSEATPEQWRETQVHNYASWGSGFSINDYQRREEELCRHSGFGQKGNHTGWSVKVQAMLGSEADLGYFERVLVPKEDPTTVVDIASSCESFERPIYIKDTASPTGRRDICVSICSVYTPVHNRGRGFAGRMLTLLHRKLAEKGILSVLYSDVGDYYSRIKQELVDSTLAPGWEVVEPYNVTWPVKGDTGKSRNGFKTIDETSIGKICEQDALLLQEEVLSCPSQSAFSILPTKDQMDWQIARTKFYDTFRHPKSRYDYPYIDDWGCQLGKPGDPDCAFAIWSYDIPESNLTILRLRCNTPEQLAEVVELAQKAASKQGMKTITAWNVEPGLLEGTPWQNVKREEHLPALAWYGEGPRPQWVCNEVCCPITA